MPSRRPWSTTQPWRWLWPVLWPDGPFCYPAGIDRDHVGEWFVLRPVARCLLAPCAQRCKRCQRSILQGLVEQPRRLASHPTPCACSRLAVSAAAFVYLPWLNVRARSEKSERPATFFEVHIMVWKRDPINLHATPPRFHPLFLEPVRVDTKNICVF